VELVGAAISAPSVTFAVVAAVGYGWQVLVAFIAGAGSSAVVAYVAFANRVIRDASRHG